MTNCCLIDFEGMLRNGFKIGNAEVESPKSIQTATAQISQIIANVASSQYGVARLTGSMRSWPLMQKRTTKNTWQMPKSGCFLKSKRTMLGARLKKISMMPCNRWNMRSIPSLPRTGKLPLLRLALVLEPIASNGNPKGDFGNSDQGTWIGTSDSHLSKTDLYLKRGLNLEPGTPNYDIKQLALECATKRMYPDVLSYDKIVELTGSFKVPMGCRSFLQGWKDENGVEVNSGRMNLGVVTVNLPRIALESGGDKEKFWQIFNERMNIAEDALVYRVERTKEATPANAPILYQYGAFGKRLGKYDQVDQLFRHRRATVSLGYIGLYEVATVFMVQIGNTIQKPNNSRLISSRI